MRLTNPFIELGIHQGKKEGIREGLTKGLHKGLRRGLRQGHHEEGVRLVLRMLARRLGALPVSQKRKIQRLDLAKIEALAESLLEFKSRAALALWLKKNAS